MKSKHEIPNKTDYMKAYSFNFIQTERTNTELAHEKNVGKIDGAFYRSFSWQIMGKQKERQLSHGDANDIVSAKRKEALSERTPTTNGKLQEARYKSIRKEHIRCKKMFYRYTIRKYDSQLGAMLEEAFIAAIIVILFVMIDITKMGNRRKYLPAKIKKNPETNELFVKLVDKNVRIHPHEHGESKVVVQTRTDLKGKIPQRYISTCYFKPTIVPAWYTESLLIRIGSTKRTYDEKVWFKPKLQPYYWSENMTTEVNFPPMKKYTSTAAASMTASHEHYISLEAQQIAAGAS